MSDEKEITTWNALPLAACYRAQCPRCLERVGFNATGCPKCRISLTPCPKCKDYVIVGAKICPHCRSNLNEGGFWWHTGQIMLLFGIVGGIAGIFIDPVLCAGSSIVVAMVGYTVRNWGGGA